MERARPTILLPKPMPERIAQATFTPDIKPPKPLLILSVGLHVVTEDHMGCKIIPTTNVAVIIGEADVGHDGLFCGNTEKNVFDLGIGSARTLAQRMIEMCDAAEAGETHAA